MNYKDFFESKMLERFWSLTEVYKNDSKGEISLNTREVKEAIREGQTAQLKITAPEADNQNILMDLVGYVNVAIKDAVQEIFDESVSPLYNYANMDFYKNYTDYYKVSPKLTMYIKQIYTMCQQAIAAETKIEKEQYETMRNAIYTKATELNVNKEDVIKIAISAAMTRVVKTKQGIKFESNEKNFKSYAVSRIFTNEFIATRSNHKITEELEILDMQRDIANNESIEFVDGVSVDGMIELTTDFTGIAYEENEALVYDIDIYAYEEVKALVTKETFSADSTMNNLKRNNGEAAEYFFETAKEIKIVGTNNNVLKSGQRIVATIEAEKENADLTIDNVLSFGAKDCKQITFLIVVK